MSCETTISVLPRLQVAKRGAKFAIGLDWRCHLQNGETLSTAATTLEASPADSATILPVSNTSISGTGTVIVIEVPSDAPYGDYHLRHTVTTSTGRIYVECFTIRVEPC